MADAPSLAIKQLLIGFQKTISTAQWNPKRLYELLRLLTDQVTGQQIEINEVKDSITNITPGGEGLDHGQVMRRISVRI